MLINLKSFPETIEGKEPLIIWFDSGHYMGLVDRGDSVAIYDWDGMTEVWIQRHTFDKATLKQSRVEVNRNPKGF